jgi:hypothetical protein
MPNVADPRPTVRSFEGPASTVASCNIETRLCDVKQRRTPREAAAEIKDYIGFWRGVEVTE